MTHEGRGRGRGRRPLPSTAASCGEERTYFSAEGPVPVEVPEPVGPEIEVMTTLLADHQILESSGYSESSCGADDDGEPMDQAMQDLDPEDAALKLLQECPPNMAPEEYARKLKATLIKKVGHRSNRTFMLV